MSFSFTAVPYKAAAGAHTADGCFSDFIFSDKLNGCAPSGTAVFAQTRY